MSKKKTPDFYLGVHLPTNQRSMKREMPPESEYLINLKRNCLMTKLSAIAASFLPSLIK